jgi:glycosyltransferase involved in cell wall biosynthesis
MRIFLVSSYHSGSHRAWADGYAASSNHEVHLVTMPGAFWQWRLTGAFVSLAVAVDELSDRHGRPDAILATSLVDVAGLRGMVSRGLGQVPTALYMHENQITYPAISRSRTERNYGLINWTSLIAADAVAFNSEFHRDALMTALPPFLNEFPDERQHDHLETVQAKSVVLPVGCTVDEIPLGPKDDPPLVLWNHRWDPDKDPSSFIAVMARLAETGIDFRIALTGERFVKQRREYDESIAALDHLVVVDDHLERSEYLKVLGRSTIVMSTALQEFFGVSIVEAMAAGALPILPRRLVYPERIPFELGDRTLYGSQDEAVELLTAALGSVEETRALGAELKTAVERYDWSVVAPAYDDWLRSIVSS